MYTSFYQLREEPFRLTSDPRFFHLAESHAAALATLVEVVMRRKGFAVLSGQIGLGKTTVLHAALRILNESASADNSLASAFVLNPMLTRDEFLEMILAEFEISSAGVSKPARLAALQRMLLNSQSKGGTSVLLVDEAHLLSAELFEEIRLISNADTYQEKPLQIILCGQPELLTILERPELRALRQRIARSCTLRALTLPELCVYIAERLHAAGFQGETQPFPDSVVERVFQYTQGVPRLINLLCDACLTIGYKTQQSVIQADMVEQAAAEFGMNQTPIVAPLFEKVPVHVKASESSPTVALQEIVTVSANRTETPRSAPPQEKVEVPVNGNSRGEEPSEVIGQTAVDLLIRSMKQRRASTVV
jgi:general secretion pathway protein A